jgi:hypothetical protein
VSQGLPYRPLWNKGLDRVSFSFITENTRDWRLSAILLLSLTIVLTRESEFNETVADLVVKSRCETLDLCFAERNNCVKRRNEYSFSSVIKYVLSTRKGEHKWPYQLFCSFLHPAKRIKTARDLRRAVKRRKGMPYCSKIFVRGPTYCFSKRLGLKCKEYSLNPKLSVNPAPRRRKMRIKADFSIGNLLH